MSSSVEMPALGESVTEGTVTRWLKQVGERVEVDEPLLEVSTDKVDTEIPSPVAGVLQKILVDEDETVEVGAQLAVIGDGEGDAASDDGGERSGTDEPADQQSATEQSGSDEPASSEQSPPNEQAEAPSTDAEEPQQAESAPSPAPAEQQPQASSQGDESSGDDAPSGDGDGGGDGTGGGGGTEVKMPALGESVTEGTVTRWLKSEGDTVEVDEPLLEVSTDKVDTEIPSPVAGTLQKILVGEDETVEVGAPLALVGDGSSGDSSGGAEQPSDSSGDQPPADQPPAEQPQAGQPPAEQPQAEQPQTEEPAAEEPGTEQASAPEAEEAAAPRATLDVGAEEPTAQAEQSGQQARPSSGGDASYVTPLVRKLAAEHGVELSSLGGTGVGGRIRKQDVLAAAEEARTAREAAPEAEEKAAQAPAATPAAAATSAPGAAGPSGQRGTVAPQRGTTEKMSRLRKVIATRMVESLQVSAQLTTVVEVDVTKIARLRARAKSSFEAREGVKLSFLPFFALATVEALKAHPRVNATLNDDEIVYPAQENLGVAVDTERGLLVPVIRDAGDLNIAGLARKVADLADRTRNNKITPDELGGGTFTLTNTGSRGALFDTPIINQPQVGILGTGAVVKRPVVISDSEGGETIAVRSMVFLALSYDHRIVDGADAARFLTTIKERLEEGAFDADLNL